MNCKNCNNVFEPKRKSGKFCSGACRAEYSNKHRENVASKFDIINTKLDVVLGYLKTGVPTVQSSVLNEPTTFYGKILKRINEATTEAEVRNIQEDIVANKNDSSLKGNQYQFAYNAAADKLYQILKNK